MPSARSLAVLLAASPAACFNPSGQDDRAGTTTAATTSTTAADSIALLFVADD